MRRIEAAPKIPEISIASHQVYTSKPIRCYCLSDLHADAERNQKWVRENCKRYEQDKDYFTVMIIPGDIGAEVDRILSVLKVCTGAYNAVCYIPGNHEAWRKGILAGGSALHPENRAPNREANDSIVKLVEVLESAEELGVYVGPLKITSTFTEKATPPAPSASAPASVSSETETVFNTLQQLSIQPVEKEKDEELSPAETSSSSSSSSSSSVIVVPLYSWYHASWDKEPELTHPDVLEVESWMPFNKKWGDFSLCRWPPQLVSHTDFENNSRYSTSLAEAFARLNEPFLYAPPYKSLSTDSASTAPSVPLLDAETRETETREAETSFSKQLLGTPLQDSPNDTVLSFSHFLPRVELCPEKRFLLEPGLSKVGICMSMSTPIPSYTLIYPPIPSYTNLYPPTPSYTLL